MCLPREPCYQVVDWYFNYPSIYHIVPMFRCSGKCGNPNAKFIIRNMIDQNLVLKFQAVLWWTFQFIPHLGSHGIREPHPAALRARLAPRRASLSSAELLPRLWSCLVCSALALRSASRWREDTDGAKKTAEVREKNVGLTVEIKIEDILKSDDPSTHQNLWGWRPKICPFCCRMISLWCFVISLWFPFFPYCFHIFNFIASTFFSLWFPLYLSLLLPYDFHIMSRVPTMSLFVLLFFLFFLYFSAIISLVFPVPYYFAIFAVVCPP